jgi:hypothetical protein
MCSPVTSGTVGTTSPDNTVQFNAQGIFGVLNQPKSDKYRDVTNNTSTLWNPVTASVMFPGVITYLGNGQFVGVTPGCTYFTVSDAGFSQSVSVAVSPIPSPCPTPPGTAPLASASNGPSPTP